MGIWKKQNLIFQANGQFGWMNSHAQVPTVWQKDAATLRIFFATRPEPGLSLPAFLDVAADDPSRILYVHDRPILQPGRPGTFDEHGIMPSCAINHGNKLYLYYSGWSRSVGVPYSNLTGLAVSNDGVHFERVCEGPVLTRTPYEPYSATSPFVVRQGNEWLSWYCSGTGWKAQNGNFEHQYDIKSATSKNGIWWQQDGTPIIRSEHQSEALTRPSVISWQGSYHMWFCYRGMQDFRDGAESYRIGYATSPDLRSWRRDDLAGGLIPSADGWDSIATAYPYVISQGKSLSMFYNGNGFGASGFGWATTED